MANDRWRDDDRQSWDRDRERYGRQSEWSQEDERQRYAREGSREAYGRERSGREGYGREGFAREGYARGEYGRSDYGRSDYGRSDRGRDYGAGAYGGYGYGGYAGPNYGEGSRDRDWWDRTKDEVRSWMGDEEAERRRRMDTYREYGSNAEFQRRGHYGRGPRGYTRSDQRILEDINDRLTEDWRVDASDIEVAVTSGEVTLSGTVDSRDTKRLAENIAADVSGVRDVQNNLRVRQQTYQSGNLTGSSSAALEQTTGLSSGTSTRSSTTGSTTSTSSRPKH